MSVMIQYFREDTPQVEEVLNNYGLRLQETREVIKNKNTDNEGSDLLSSHIKTGDNSIDIKLAQELSFVPGTVVKVI